MTDTPASLKQSFMCHIILFLSCVSGDYSRPPATLPLRTEHPALCSHFIPCQPSHWEADNTQMSQSWANSVANLSCGEL